ncbi:hypothetical protein [Tabrizicola sp.]|uniref:hypothetical protein n=1 Tax=Tabrizicola sp. TaxID=2005166 RepID=UPI002628A110|nr:hypothetical protein [Tabrizicola sp.]MDM7930512.1 hypothetical protein [Tabrizicola sp.]
MRPFISALALSAAATSAHADCPASPADLDGGITVTFDDGSVSRLNRDADGMIVERTNYNDAAGMGFEARSKFGFAYLESADTEKGAVISDRRILYDYGPGGLDLVTAPDTETTGFTTQRALTFSDGFKRDQRVTFRTREYVDRQWGDCSYRVLPVWVSDSDSDDGRAQAFDYVPDLGVAVFVSVNEWEVPIWGAQPVSIVLGPGPAEE